MNKQHKIMNALTGMTVFAFMIYISSWLSSAFGNSILSICAPTYIILSFMIPIIDLNISFRKRVKKFYFWLLIIHIVSWFSVYLLEMVNSVSPDQNPNTFLSNVSSYLVISTFLQISVIFSKLLLILVNDQSNRNDKSLLR